MTEKQKVGDLNDKGQVWICCRYIVKNGHKIYPKNGKAFCFWTSPKEK